MRCLILKKLGSVVLSVAVDAVVSGATVIVVNDVKNVCILVVDLTVSNIT